MKKSLSRILALTMVFTMFASAAFAAVPTPEAAATPSVTYTPQQAFDALKAAGIDTGDPEGTLTRAQFSKVIVKLWALPEAPEASMVYSDLEGAGWAAGSIGAVTKAGYLNGIGGGKFNPYGNVTLEQVAKVFAVALKLDTTDTTVTGKVSAWAKGYVAAAIKLGIIAASTDYTVAAKRGQLFVTGQSDEIFDSGKLIPSAYIAMASDYSSDKAIAYRYGPSYSFYNPTPETVPTYWKPDDQIFYPHGNECFKKDFPNDTYDYESNIVYQLGSVDCTKNDYGSNMGDVIYRSDDSTDPGVTSLLTLDLSAGVIAEKPQLPWVYHYENGGGSPDPMLNKYISANGGVVPTKPIAMGRCSEHDCAQALVAFQNGLIASVGSNTASHTASVKLPAGKVPTAIAITPNSEFALVTIWDTVNLKGQVAVLALGSLADGSQVGGPYDPSPMGWPDLYPGLRNLSNFVFIKLLGFVDLPGMVAPTDISASTDFSAMQDDTTQGWMIFPTGNDGASATKTDVNPSTSSTNQKSFAFGGVNSRLISHSGVAAVISKSEKKVIFLNLKPLFDKVNNTYFEGSFDSLKSTLANTGLGDSQWPPVFTVDNYAPTIIKTISLAAKPTVVKVSILANPGQAWVATEDGRIHAFSVAGVQSGLNFDPSLIKEENSLQVGRNPTSMIYQVNRGKFGNSNNKLWVVSRGDRKVQLVNMGALTIENTLQDSRIVDPITVDETQQSPLLTSVITITDYAGKQVMNYRYAPISLQGGNTPLDIGIGQSGNDLFEFGGAYAVPGKPFNFTQSNVP